MTVVTRSYSARDSTDRWNDGMEGVGACPSALSFSLKSPKTYPETFRIVSLLHI
jgi:hypothetical protein